MEVQIINLFGQLGKLMEQTCLLDQRMAYGFTGTTPSGYDTGVYYIGFGKNPYKDAHYTNNVSNQASLFCKTWEAIVPTVNGFYIICYTNATTPGNAIFHFQLLHKLI